MKISSIIFALFGCTGMAFAIEFSELQAKFKVASDKLTTDESTARKVFGLKYFQALDGFIQKAQAAGNLPMVLQAQEEKKRFEEDAWVSPRDSVHPQIQKLRGTLRSGLDRISEEHAVKRLRLHQAYQQQVADIVKTLTQNSQIDEALRVQKEAEATLNDTEDPLKSVRKKKKKTGADILSSVDFESGTGPWVLTSGASLQKEVRLKSGETRTHVHVRLDPAKPQGVSYPIDEKILNAGGKMNMTFRIRFSKNYKPASRKVGTAIRQGNMLNIGTRKGGGASWSNLDYKEHKDETWFEIAYGRSGLDPGESLFIEAPPGSGWMEIDDIHMTRQN